MPCPALPSGGSRLFRQGRPGCAQHLPPPPPPRGSDTCRVTLGVSLPTPAVPHKRQLRPKHPRSQRAEAKPHLVSAYREPKNRRQSTKNQQMHVHTHALLPSSSPAMFNRLRTAFLSSLGDDAETCFAGTAVFALPAFSRAAPGSRAQLLLPSPNLWVSDLFPVATEIPLHRQNVRRHE